MLHYEVISRLSVECLKTRIPTWIQKKRFQVPIALILVLKIWLKSVNNWGHHCSTSKRRWTGFREHPLQKKISTSTHLRKFQVYMWKLWINQTELCWVKSTGNKFWLYCWRHCASTKSIKKINGYTIPEQYKYSVIITLNKFLVCLNLKYLKGNNWILYKAYREPKKNLKRINSAKWPWQRIWLQIRLPQQMWARKKPKKSLNPKFKGEINGMNGFVLKHLKKLKTPQHLLELLKH